jgi:hypothetical protein
MLLYDVVYFGSGMDSNTILPNCKTAIKNGVKYAVCTNGAREYGRKMMLGKKP